AQSQGDDVDKRLAVKAQRHRPAQLRVVEGGGGRVDEQSTRYVGRHDLADRLRRLALDILQQRYRHAGDRVELPGNEAQYSRRDTWYYRILDAVEIGSAVLPVIRISGYPDQFIGFEFDEFEGAGADRSSAHV